MHEKGASHVLGMRRYVLLKAKPENQNVNTAESSTMKQYFIRRQKAIPELYQQKEGSN